ncbi:hypothetical protein EDD86DRAFT_17287 [Gorgonomyces haynaldii]|nr:hypothetical protein EDD86DRAFT_17287 [Gorgonomyces haynaldii]
MHLFFLVQTVSSQLTGTPKLVLNQDIGLISVSEDRVCDTGLGAVVQVFSGISSPADVVSPSSRTVICASKQDARPLDAVYDPPSGKLFLLLSDATNFYIYTVYPVSKVSTLFYSGPVAQNRPYAIGASNASPILATESRLIDLLGSAGRRTLVNFGNATGKPTSLLSIKSTLYAVATSTRTFVRKYQQNGTYSELSFPDAPFAVQNKSLFYCQDTFYLLIKTDMGLGFTALSNDFKVSSTKRNVLTNPEKIQWVTCNNQNLVLTTTDNALTTIAPDLTVLSTQYFQSLQQQQALFSTEFVNGVLVAFETKDGQWQVTSSGTLASSPKGSSPETGGSNALSIGYALLGCAIFFGLVILGVVLSERKKKSAPLDKVFSSSTLGEDAVPSIREITWHSVNYSVPIRKSKELKPLLVNVSGKVSAGQVVAIMGGSGAGKTTLLNTLAGRIGPGTLTGQIHVDGQQRDPSMWKIQCAYVEQDDIMFDNLTVYETIRYSAFLRLPRTMTKQEKLDRVEGVIAALGLSNVRNTFIGSATQRGISGGERKRVSIGIELVTNPHILFLDEPTSGLDAFNALNVISTLKELAVKENKIVLLTIHQPRTDIINLFDEIILLAQGQCFWSGSNTNALEHFKNLGFEIPEKTNPSDFYLDIGTIDQRTPELKAASSARVQTLIDHYHDLQPESTAQDKDLESSGRTSWPSTWLNEFTTLLERNLLDTVRNKGLLFASIGQAIFIDIIIGFIFWRLDTDVAGVQSRSGVLFFLIINQTFGVIQPVINVFPLQREIFKRERAAGSYRPSSAYLAKVVAATPFPLFSCLLIALPIYWMIGLQNNALKYLTFIGIMLLQTFTANCLGLAIGASVPNVTVGQIAAPLIVIIFFLFGGLFVNLEKVPVVFRWIQWISFIAYSNKAINQNEFDANLVFRCTPGQPCYKDGTQVISALALGDPPIWQCELSNVAIAAGFLILGLIGFSRSSRPLSRLK